MRYLGLRLVVKTRLTSLTNGCRSSQEASFTAIKKAEPGLSPLLSSYEKHCWWLQPFHLHFHTYTQEDAKLRMSLALPGTGDKEKTMQGKELVGMFIAFFR